MVKRGQQVRDLSILDAIDVRITDVLRHMRHLPQDADVSQLRRFSRRGVVDEGTAQQHAGGRDDEGTSQRGAARVDDAGTSQQYAAGFDAGTSQPPVTSQPPYGSQTHETYVPSFGDIGSYPQPQDQSYSLMGIFGQMPPYGDFRYSQPQPQEQSYGAVGYSQPQEHPYGDVGSSQPQPQEQAYGDVGYSQPQNQEQPYGAIDFFADIGQYPHPYDAAGLDIGQCQPREDVGASQSQAHEDVDVGESQPPQTPLDVSQAPPAADVGPSQPGQGGLIPPLRQHYSRKAKKGLKKLFGC